MENYFLFLIIAATTILTPGPGVLFTLTTSARYGATGTIGVIFGMAIGSFVVAGISATSIGFILSTSPTAFKVMKIFGAIYLIYLGIKLWVSPIIIEKQAKKIINRNLKVQFVEGFTLQVTNPKEMLFFFSILPLFIDHTSDYMSRFVLLVITYSCFVIVIHSSYAFLAEYVRGWISSKKGLRIISCIGSIVFIIFGVTLGLI